jgi:UDP-2,3-diacylglucosamine hydrolase
MSVLFVSDIHLSPERPAIVRAYLDFLSQPHTETEALYILGDLFEAWIGDDDPSEMALNVKNALKALSEKGVKLYVQRGNRDFTLGKSFASQTGAQLLDDEHVIDYFGLTALVMHGDSLCTDDLDYQKFRRKSRHPIYLWCLIHLPLKIRQNIASNWRRQSAAANSNKASEIMDVNSQAVIEVMSKHNVSTLIHGHTHRPDTHHIDIGRRIVLGDWDQKGWCLTLNEQGLNQTSFTIV